MIEHEVHRLDFEGKQFDEQLQDFWERKLQTELSNRHFDDLRAIEIFIQDELFSNVTYYRDAENLRMGREGEIKNLRTIQIKEVEIPIIFGNNEQKIAKIKMEILFRLIVPQNHDITIGANKFISAVPDLQRDSYVGNIDIEIT
ncbi:MAG: hypothetical protein WA057_06490 [Candidatus Magasanikiibacteriota bacterium]